MERTSFSVLFYLLRTRLNKNGEAPVMLRLTVNGQREDLRIHRTIRPDLWDGGKGRANNKSKDGKELNLYMEVVRSRLLNARTQIELESIPVTAANVVNRYLGKDRPERHTLMEAFTAHVKVCNQLKGIDMAPATVQRYTTCMHLMQEFLKMQYKRDDIYLDELSRQFIDDYEIFLKTVRRCSHNTTTKYLKNFKTVILLALRKKWQFDNPFADIKFKLDKVEPEFLEVHEMKQIMDKRIDVPRLVHVRDIFIFCCFTGLAFSDVSQLKTEHIVIDVNGDKWIRKSRQKTNNMCNIPLLEIPLAILEKYKDDEYCKKKGVLLPVPSNQKMNAYLKEIADICGITKNISTHTARHTFATYALAEGVTLECVAKMLGHADAKMTRHYARVLDRTVYKEMKGVRMPTAM